MAFASTSSCTRMFLHGAKLKVMICNIKQSDCWRCRLGGEYIQMFQQKLQRNDLILRDELKVLLHLCQTPEDMIIAKAAICRYHQDNRNATYTEFKFGPLFMRLCYELNMEEMAECTIKDKSLKGFFPDSTSFNIMMDMLFMKGHYESALEVLADMRNQGVPFNKDTFILAFAICYKLNTAKSYRICIMMLEEAQMKGFLIPRHAYYFAVALALKQEDVEKAKSLFSQIMTTSNRISQNLQVYILAMDGALKDILSVLTSALDCRSPTFVKKPEFSEELVSGSSTKWSDALQCFLYCNVSEKHFWTLCYRRSCFTGASLNLHLSLMSSVSLETHFQCLLAFTLTPFDLFHSFILCISYLSIFLFIQLLFTLPCFFRSVPSFYNFIGLCFSCFSVFWFYFSPICEAL
uniref:Pentatricopeptide repeat-containing protein 2, mitochondrial n=1 Tax=Paramormyrops kingsleyae TaxID=1676925 RepID=A0A3B3Q553_9TELE